MFDFVHPCYICRDKSLFTRVMTCEHEKETLPSGENVVIEAIEKHSDIVRKLRGKRYIPKMIQNIISLKRLEMIKYTIKVKES